MARAERKPLLHRDDHGYCLFTTGTSDEKSRTPSPSDKVFIIRLKEENWEHDTWTSKSTDDLLEG